MAANILAYNLYVEMVEELGKTPKLTKADFTLTKRKQRQYKLYRAKCRALNVEPVLADFLAGEVPDGVIHLMELEQNEREWERRKVMVATAAA